MVAAVPVAVAQGSDVDSVTGGGELVLDASQQLGQPGEGPGDTYTFTARQTPDATSAFGPLAADGEVQWVDRRGSARGRDNSIFHGRVVCLRVQGNQAVILYRPMYANAPETEQHQLYVFDNDEPSDDVIINDMNADFPCAFSLPLDATSVQLGRGEVRVHEAE
jgi:hypothetical protein